MELFSPAYKTPISYALFDMDGTLLNTETLYIEIFSKMFEKYGKTYTMEIREKILGTPAEFFLKYCSDMINVDGVSPEVLRKDKHEIQEAMFPQAQLLPGVEKLVRHLKKHQIPIAVATSSATHEFNLKTTCHKEFFSLFDAIVKGDDPEVKQGKPQPDIFLVALKRLNPLAKPNQSLVFEDSPNGVMAGFSAGMPVVAIPDGVPLEKFAYASQIINSWDDFLPEAWGLPCYD